MIHPLADVQTDKIGEGTRIWQFCVVLPDVEIGSNCNVCAHVLIENGVKVGNNVTLKSGVQLWTGLEVEDNVFIGPNATFTNDHAPRSGQHPDKYLETRICRGASVGANATILCGITIGENAMTGVGSFVTKDVSYNTVWYGNLAMLKGYIVSDKCITPIGHDIDSGGGFRILYSQAS